MPKMRWLARLRKQWRRIRLVVLILGPLLTLTLWMAFQHKPGWYAPVTLDQSGRRLARRSATRRADEFGDALVRREPFELILHEDQVNRWLAATPSLWPRGESIVVRDPAVHLESGLIRFGALVDRNGWLTIFSAGIQSGLSDDGDTVTIRLVEPAAGALPIPRAVLSWVRPATRTPLPGSPGRGGEPQVPVESLLPDVQSVDDLLEGLRRPNWFVWPNGDRAFSIDSITVESGRVSLAIRPR